MRHLFISLPFHLISFAQNKQRAVGGSEPHRLPSYIYWRLRSLGLKAIKLSNIQLNSYLQCTELLAS